MSDREKIVQLLDEVPAYKLGYILAYVQGLTADEDADDAYCEQLYQNYLKDPDRGQTLTEDEVCKQLGIALLAIPSCTRSLLSSSSRNSQKNSSGVSWKQFMPCPIPATSSS